MHVIIQAKQPVTVAMVNTESWNTAQQHPEVWGNMAFRCLREHVTSTTYECHLPPREATTLVIHDERTPERAIVRGIGAILSQSGTRVFMSPNDVQITYHSWSCVANCIQPEYGWVRLVKEKYELSPVPMTLAVLPSAAADQVYDKPEQLSSALAQTSCKQRGVQSMEFDCLFNVADGPQSLLIIPDIKSHKKAEIDVQTFKCVEHCELLVPAGTQP